MTVLWCAYGFKKSIPPIINILMPPIVIAVDLIYRCGMKLTPKAKAAFAEWGRQGGIKRSKGKTKEQRSAIAKKAWATRKAAK